MGNMKFNVGDRVRIKNFDWFRNCGVNMFVTFMAKYYGEVVTIKSVHKDFYRIKEDGGQYCWTDKMIDCLVERNGKSYPYKIGDRVVLKGNDRYATITDLKYNSWGNLSYYIKIDNDKDICIDYPTDLLLPYDNMVEGLVGEETKPKYEDEVNGEYYSTPKYLVRPSGYQFVDENGNVINAMKIILEKKKKEYPKTFEECVHVLEGENRMSLEQMNTFRKLIDARNAYWKIYGEENGLGKPWEPDYRGTFEHGTPIKYVIYNIGTHIVKQRKSSPNHILSFPTEEMAYAFYENFKAEIELCKELL